MGIELRKFIISKLLQKCYLDGNMKLVERLPLSSVMKQNVKNYKKRQDKAKLENKMLDYLKSHDC